METALKLDEVRTINAEHIVDPPNPNRIELSQVELQELAESIKKDGLINPIMVRPVGDKFEVVAGHRRFRACLIAGVINIKCVVRTLTDAEAEDIKAHENLFRQDLDPLEEAIYLGRLIGDDDTQIPVVAARMNKTEQWVTDRLNILTMPDYLRGYIRGGNVGLGVAKWLGAIGDEVYRKIFSDQAANNGMSIRQAEYLYRQWELGLLKDSTTFMPPVGADGQRQEYHFKAPCAKCGDIATDPNVQSVWIHKECPGSEAVKDTLTK